MDERDPLFDDDLIDPDRLPDFVELVDGPAAAVAGPEAGGAMLVSGAIWEWRGPAPFHFVTVPDADSARIKALQSVVTYGWGMIPVRCRIGRTEFKTALWPKDGRFVVPLKDAVRHAERLKIGDTVTIELTVGR